MTSWTLKLFRLTKLTVLFLLLSACAVKSNQSTDRELSMQDSKTQKKIVIAHRGASGYLPEHSLASKAMAYAMDVDYIEQDVVLTKDDQIIVLHDLYLERVTNVVQIFPNRYRNVDGKKRWLAIDFTLEEIKQLKMTEGFNISAETNQPIQGYPDRFPMFKSSFQVATLAEEIELIQGLNQSTGRDVGIYVEIKAPWFHRMEGKDISTKVLKILKHYGYQSKRDKAYLQCFDPKETRRIHDDLMPSLNMELKLVQLIAMTEWQETMHMVEGKLTNYSYDWMFEKNAMQKVAEYADGIGPWMPMLVSDKSTSDNIIDTGMLANAHQQGLEVHPYTFRLEKDKTPPYAKNFNHLLDIFLYQIGVDGVFTDFPDLAVEFIKQKENQ